MESIDYLNDYIKRSGYPDIFTVSEEEHFFSQSGKITSIYLFDLKADMPHLEKLSSKFAPEYYSIKEGCMIYRLQIESDNEKESYRLVAEFINRTNRVIYETLFNGKNKEKDEPVNKSVKKRMIPPKNPNQRPTRINMDRSIARMRAETRELLRRYGF